MEKDSISNLVLFMMYVPGTGVSVSGCFRPHIRDYPTPSRLCNKENLRSCKKRIEMVDSSKVAFLIAVSCKSL